MKKFILFIVISKLSLALGGIEIGTAPSVSSVANPAQTASVNAQSPFFNPAATMFLENGEYIYLGTFGVFPDYETQYNGNTFLKTTTFQPVPSFSYINKKNNYSYFIASGSLGQGGFLKYNVSYDAIDDFHLTAINPGIIIGGSFFITKNISTGISARIIYSRLEAKGSIKNEGTFKSYIETIGIAPEISLFYTPTEKINLGIKYLFKTKLDYDGKVKEGSKYIINKVFGKFSVDHRKDFPGVLSLGGLYKINETQRLSLGFNWIMESKKTIDSKLYHKYKYSEITSLYTVLGVNFYKTDHSKLNDETISTKRREPIFGIGLEMKI